MGGADGTSACRFSSGVDMAGAVGPGVDCTAGRGLHVLAAAPNLPCVAVVVRTSLQGQADAARGSRRCASRFRLLPGADVPLPQMAVGSSSQVQGGVAVRRGLGRWFR